jgi:segregation and condensation protein B
MSASLAACTIFLDYFGLKSLDELPPLAELTAMGDFPLQLPLGDETVPAPQPPESSATQPEGAEDAGAADDAGDDDELSADGGGSTELVAGPRSLDD